ncbi:MAG: hypothetical protein ACRCUX_04710 [Beijerinckiaceae bacterium]
MGRQGMARQCPWSVADHRANRRFDAFRPGLKFLIQPVRVDLRGWHPV